VASGERRLTGWATGGAAGGGELLVGGAALGSRSAVQDRGDKGTNGDAAVVPVAGPPVSRGTAPACGRRTTASAVSAATTPTDSPRREVNGDIARRRPASVPLDPRTGRFLAGID
jgi:hypothetical protein